MDSQDQEDKEIQETSAPSDHEALPIGGEFQKFTPKMLKETIDSIQEIHNDVKEMHGEIGSFPKIFQRLLKTPKRVALSTAGATAIIIVIAALLSLLFFKIFLSKSNVSELRMVVTRYGLVESKANYMMILKRVKEINRLLPQTIALCGRKVSKRGRMTAEDMEDYTSCVYAGKVWYDIDVELSLAITAAESEWNKKAKSHRNARGVWQLLMMTFNWMNKDKLDKFGEYNIYNVFHNSEAAIRYIAYLKSRLGSRLKRTAKSLEIAYAYHAGRKGAMSAIVSGKYKRYLSPDTIDYGKKVMFYLKEYQDGNYGAWWYAQFFRKKDKKR